MKNRLDLAQRDIQLEDRRIAIHLIEHFCLNHRSLKSLGASLKKEDAGQQSNFGGTLAFALSTITEDFQELITKYAWGTIWSWPGLDYRTPRLLVLVMMAALGRWEEFRLHVSAGLLHGLEICDNKESLLQTAIYAGVPAANTTFHLAEEEMNRLGVHPRSVLSFVMLCGFVPSRPIALRIPP